MKPFVIFGGAGFIGTNLAARVASTGQKVRIVDNLSRQTSAINAGWLRETFPDRIELVRGDVRDRDLVKAALSDAVAVVHFAAQVAVTTSMVDPRHDFDVNLVGTFNVLEALRGRKVPLVFASTNKVYGALAGVPLQEGPGRWEPTAELLKRTGISEAAPLQFASPFGCSKGAADQYVLDHAECYGMPNVVFRMSCIYGPHQFGNDSSPVSSRAGWRGRASMRSPRSTSRSASRCSRRRCPAARWCSAICLRCARTGATPRSSSTPASPPN